MFILFIYGERDNALRRLQKGINKKYRLNRTGVLSDKYRIGFIRLCLKSALIIKLGDFIGRTGEIVAIHDLL